MRRLSLVAALTLLLMAPATPAQASGCPDEGTDYEVGLHGLDLSAVSCTDSAEEYTEEPRSGVHQTGQTGRDLTARPVPREPAWSAPRAAPVARR